MRYNSYADDWGIVVAAFKQTILPNTTTVGTATAIAASSSTINVSMPYTVDNNANNTYTVEYKLSSAGGWTNWITNATDTASPYTTTITGLSPASNYDVRVTYNDADGVTGTNPQTINNVMTGLTDTSVRFTGNGNPLTQSYTVGSGGDLLVVSIVAGGNTGRTGGAPTYNGVALTQADANRTATALLSLSIHCSAQAAPPADNEPLAGFRLPHSNPPYSAPEPTPSTTACSRALAPATAPAASPSIRCPMPGPPHNRLKCAGAQFKR